MEGRARQRLSLPQRDAAEHDRPSPWPGRACSDSELADHIRQQIAASRLHGEGYRKLWALRAYVFVAVEHANSEVVGIHAARSANRFEALEPVRQGVHRCFGSIAPGVARGLMLRHDHGSNYMSGDFQEEIECLGIEASPSFVREPEGNGVAERFIRTSHGDVQVKGVVLG